MRTWSKALFLGLLSLLSTIVPVGIASASSTSSTFHFLAGTGATLCSLASNACPDVAMADNGDTVSIAGQGSVSVQPNSVSGSGTFVHKAPDGTVKAMGTWTALQLFSFRTWGNSPGLPANLVGGQAIMLVQLTSTGGAVHTAVLTVICDVGNPPTGLLEGVKLVVQDTPFNFNKQVSGFTVFISS